MASYTVAQIVGAVLGAELANLMYQVPLDELSTKHRTGAHLLLGEVVATAGLVALIFALARTGRGILAAPAVGAYIGAAYWFTSSTSFANPAVTVGRVFSNTFAGIAPGSVPGFIGAQIVGAAIAVGLVLWLYPHIGEQRRRRRHPLRTPPQPGTRHHHQEHPMSTSDDTTTHTPQVVFACVRNGGRSVISRVLTEHYAGGRVTALSAGTQPGDHIHAEVAEVLEKLGLDTSAGAPQAAHQRHHRRQRPRHHARLWRGVPLRPRGPLPRLARRGPRRPGRGDRAPHRRRPRHPGPRPARRAGPRHRATAVHRRRRLRRERETAPDAVGLSGSFVSVVDGSLSRTLQMWLHQELLK